MELTFLKIFNPTEMRKIIIPGDGNCLFRSCGILLGIDHAKLRYQVCHILDKHKKRKIGDLTIREWLANYPSNYVSQLRMLGTQGDALCLSVISNLYERTIIVLDKNNNKISEFFANFGIPIYIQYSGNHYDALVPT